ncbi:MAG TPA: hypothetical protein PKC96_03640 [Bacilli bacterium]|nr:hypothetical protein [Bacilli bacterium]
MALTWFNKKVSQGIATIYDTNITFNTTAMEAIKTAYRVMVGFDDERNSIVVKKVSRAASIRGDIDNDSLLPLTVKNSYSRIANKKLIEKISGLAHTEFGRSPRKFLTSWDDDKEVLVVNLNEEVMK